ncbi:MAG: rod shape-determining protein RodA [Candidatus Cloacimonetes bacterium 4572_55]|nr:MAG: rod shape-determining protein RodA [Candidatus Cloacimonetes bacterium 4572_55]
MNWKLLISFILLIVGGLVILFSATQANSGQYEIFSKQIIWTILGIFSFIAVYSLPSRTIAFFTPILYGTILLTLVGVLIFPASVGGTHRWLSMGDMRFQPSELAKLSVILMLSYFLSKRDRLLSRLSEAFYLSPIALIPMILIFFEPDLGTALIIIPPVLALFYWGGLTGLQIILIMVPAVAIVSVWHRWFLVIYLILIAGLLFLSKADLFDSLLIVGITALVGIFSPLLWTHLEDYQKQRIFTTLNPGEDPLGAGYQIIQSRVAIGSGGLFGKGYLHGSQKNLSFLPEQHTDFIFSVLSEEFGFMGAVIFFTLYTFLLIQFINIALKMRNRFASCAILGISVMLLTQVTINVCMTLGILPVVGLPLPLVSYGGSSLVATIFSIGLIFSFQRKEKWLQNGS